jgi:hypothetical protein
MSEAVNLRRCFDSVPIHISFIFYVTDYSFVVFPVPSVARLLLSVKRSQVWVCLNLFTPLLHTVYSPDGRNFVVGNVVSVNACQRHCIQLGAARIAALQNNSSQGGLRFPGAKSGEFWVWFRGQLLNASELT